MPPVLLPCSGTTWYRDSTLKMKPVSGTIRDFKVLIASRSFQVSFPGPDLPKNLARSGEIIDGQAVNRATAWLQYQPERRE